MLRSRLGRLLRRGARRRVVLVTPPSSYSPHHPVVPMMPLGPLYVASSLEEAGFDVRLVDLTFVFKEALNIEAVRSEVLGLNPAVVGISAFTSTILTAYRLAEAIKREEADVHVVIGGPHASALPMETLGECPWIDAAVVGEGEHAFRSYLSLFFGGAERPRGLRGVLVRDGERILGDPRPVYVEDLDRLPFPARHLLDVERYKLHSYHERGRRHPIATIVTSRGCPHACVFCARSNSGSRYRARSPGNVVAEVELLKDSGFNEVQIVDDNFTADRRRVLEICRLLKSRRLGMSFALPNGIRADSVDEEMLREMYEAGFYSIAFGAESGDDRVLERAGKGITSAQIIEAVRAAKKVGFHVSLFVIIGLPGSTVESEERTIRLIRESGADSATASVCTPYPGSRLWEMARESLTGIPWDRYNESDVSNPIYLPDGLSREQVQLWLREAAKGGS
jgi:radical SAM superfamily enzyme YgiQ (UPF0313 family)